jgi:hypothetical protein
VKLALIPPPSNADFMLQTDYQLVLPSFLKHEEDNKYDNTVRICQERGDYIILDNGVAEGLGLDNEEDLYGLAKEFKVSEVVIPDVYGEWEPTLDKVVDWKYDEDFKHMAVVAAKTYDEARRLIDAYLDSPLIDCIGLPRLLLDHLDVGARWHFAGYLTHAIKEEGVEVHFLGMNSNFMKEMLGYSTMAKAGVRGVDTSAPFVYALEDLVWPESLGYKVARKSSYDITDLDSSYDMGSSSQLHYAERSVEYLKSQLDA